LPQAIVAAANPGFARVRSQTLLGERGFTPAKVEREARLSRAKGVPFGRSGTPPLAERHCSLAFVERFDALVVGAGPAGSMTAYHLATGGASVLLLDKASFPRDKPCGGGLTTRAVRLLPFSVDPVVEDIVDRFEFRLRYGSNFQRASSAEPLCLMTQRRRLDAHLAEQAASAGADFRDGVRVAGLELRHDGVSATVDGSRVTAHALIGADGANGVTARSVGLGGDYAYGVAFEGNVPYGPASEDRYRGRLVLELGIVPGGYGWVFPKGDHVNVGVGGWEREGPRLRGLLRGVCAAHGLAEEQLSELRGHRLPLRRPESRLARGPAALVGDAAGLVDPLTGDGMYEAFYSAKLASEAVLDLLAGRARTLEPYAASLTAGLSRLMSASWRAKLAFDRFPRLAFGIARIPLVWSVVERVVWGDLAAPGEAQGAVRAPLRLLEALGRS
jgi:geranylgeranyl reductase family protein